jgi:cell division initiation protein
MSGVLQGDRIMSLTPVDIIHTQFATAFGGYRKSEVDSFIDEARMTIEQLLQEKNELQRVCFELQDEVKRVRAIESTLAQVLTTAQAVAEDVKSSAHKQAENILQEAEIGRVRMTIEAQQSIEKCRSEIGLLESTRDRFECELRGMVTGYLEMLDRMKPQENSEVDVA